MTDAPVERGDRKVLHALAANSKANFSEFGYSALVKTAEGDEGIAEKLGLRLGIPMQLFRQLLLRATDLVRSRLVAAAPPESKDKIQSVLASIAKEISREQSGPRDFSRADNEVYELNQHGKLNEKVLAEYAHERRYEEMAAARAPFCGTKTEIIEGLLKNVNTEGLVVACKAAKSDWETVLLVFASTILSHSLSRKEADEAKAAFGELSADAARRTVRFMTVREVAKKSSRLAIGIDRRNARPSTINSFESFYVLPLNKLDGKALGKMTNNAADDGPDREGGANFGPHVDRNRGA